MAFILKRIIKINMQSDRSGSTRNLGFGFWKYREEMGLRQVEQGFSSFFSNFFLSYLMIFQKRSTLKYLDLLSMIAVIHQLDR